MKRLIAETIPLHTIEDDDLKDFNDPDTVDISEQEFYERIDESKWFFATYYLKEADKYRPRDDYYHFYLDNRVLSESSEDFYKRCAEKNSELEYEEEERAINSFKKFEEGMKQKAEQGDYDGFWNDDSIYSDFYKDTYGIRPRFDDEALFKKLDLSEEAKELMRKHKEEVYKSINDYYHHNY